MRVLVIFEIIPEETKRTIVEMSEQEYTNFTQVHGYITNVSDYEEDKVSLVNVIQNALCDKPSYVQYCETEMENAYFGKWAEQSKEDVTDLSSVDKLLHCGFYL